MFYASDQVNSKPDPLYFSALTPNTQWNKKMFQIFPNSSMGLCSTFCDFYKVNGVTCDMFVYDPVRAICYVGGVSASTNGYAVAPTGSELVYTRMCKSYFFKILEHFCRSLFE